MKGKGARQLERVYDFFYFFLDKLRKNKRDNSPDKPGTPSNDILEEGEKQEKKVIINDEILALAVKEEDLKQVTIKEDNLS